MTTGKPAAEGSRINKTKGTPGSRCGPPLRRCAGCREMKEKSVLLRVVRCPAGGYSLDLTGKSSGRGAYLCHDKDCLKKAVKKGAFARSFKGKVPQEIYEKLEARISG